MNKTDGSLKPLQWGPANNSVPHSEKKLQLPFYQAVKRNALPLAALLGNLDKEQHGGICLLDKERGCQQDSECIQVARESACMAMRKLERERERVCVCVCEREKECVCVSECVCV